MGVPNTGELHYHFSNWLNLVVRLQSLLIDLSNNKLIPAMIEDQCKACVSPLLKLSRCHSFELSFNVFLKTWPKVFSGDKLLSLIRAKVTSQRIVVVAANQLGSDDLWY